MNEIKSKMNCDCRWIRLIPAVLCLAALPALTGKLRAQEIIINEILADNNTVVPLEAFPDYTPDYVELYNTTSSDIDLAAGNWALSTSKDFVPGLNFVTGNSIHRDFFFFPAGVVIPAESYLLVYFDNDTNFPGVHTTFLLGTNRETLRLNNESANIRLVKNASRSTAGSVQRVDFTTVDNAEYGMQIPDRSVGRVPDAATGAPGAWVLNFPSPCGSTIPCTTNLPAPFLPAPVSGNELTLKINEWLALDLDGTNVDRDWFEVYNPDTNIVLMSGLVFADRGTVANIGNPNILRAVPPLTFIGPQGFVQIFCLGEGQGSANDADEVDFSLSSTSGDDIYLFASNRSTPLDVVRFGPLATSDVSRGRVPDGDPDTNNVIQFNNPSPRASNFGPIPEILITEVLAHTDPPLEDAIELQNVSNASVDVSGWWISNRRERPKKFRIPNGTVIPPGGFRVFYEFQFDPDDTGDDPSFRLNSARGDEVWLFKANPANGKLLGFRRGLDFGPSANGVSFGRVTNSAGDVDIVAMSGRSFSTNNNVNVLPSNLSVFRSGTGATNPVPLVGPLVVNEIHYHPPDVGGVDNKLDEFIEVQNISGQTLLLYDPSFPTNTWRLRGSVDYEFPPFRSLGPNKYFLFVNFNPVADPARSNSFAAAFNVPAGTPLIGPFRGSLGNGGGDVDIERPDTPQFQGPDAGLVPYILVDRINYNDDDPWPTNRGSVGPDGLGHSLQRIDSTAYGNEPLNWFSYTPTPGRFNGGEDGGEAPPLITRHPVSLTANIAANATFSVEALNGPLTYQWQFHGTNLTGETGASLSLVRISRAHAGAYWVLVSNTNGMVMSREAVLTVREDKTLPFLTVSAPAANLVTTSDMVSLRGTARDTGSGVERVEYQVGAYLTNNWSEATGSPNWAVWASTNVLLAPGTNRIFARSVDSAGNSSLTNSRSIFRSLRLPFGLHTNNQAMGGVTGATNLQQLEIGRGYTLTATPRPGHVFSNFVGSSALQPAIIVTTNRYTFLMETGLTLTAQFVTNPFVLLKGAYNGLFYETNGTGGAICERVDTAGFFTFTLLDRGTYTASLQLAGKRYPASGALNLEGEATNVIRLNASNSLRVAWHVLRDGSDVIQGSVTSLSNAVWTATLLGDRAVFHAATRPATNFAGRYTWLIPGRPESSATQPGGDGHGTAVIDRGGTVTVAGSLADSVAISQRVPVNKNGVWPFYAAPYTGGKGLIFGWVNIDTNRPNDDLHGDLCWLRLTNNAPRVYTNGIRYETNLVGAIYRPPVGTTSRIINVATGEVVFAGGHLSEALTNMVRIGLNNRVTNDGPNVLTLTLTPASGLFTGTVTVTNAGSTTPRRLTFKGALLQKPAPGYGGGYFIDTNRSGQVILQDKPLPPLPE